MDFCIKKDDISINPDGTITILNPELMAQVEESFIEPEDSLKHINNCQGGNCVKGCRLK